MLVATAVALLALPMAVPASILADLVRGRRRLPTVRVYLFLLQYLINDSVEIMAAPVFWAVAGLGTRLSSAASIGRHQRLQWWSVRLLQRRAEQLLDLRIEVDGGDGPPTGPVIALSRHVSLFDASLPSIVYQAQGRPLRGVIMAELLADPGFDLIYARLGSAFIPRDQGDAARDAIVAMTRSAEEHTAYALFPEGRLFRPAVRDRLLARLADTDPGRAARLAGLRHVLPPRPGGFQALLAALPDADVVLIHHHGFERFTSLSDLVSTVPVAEPVVVRRERFARAELPTDPDQQARWLDDRWLELDAELERRRNGLD